MILSHTLNGISIYDSRAAVCAVEKAIAKAKGFFLFSDLFPCPGEWVTHVRAFDKQDGGDLAEDDRVRGLATEKRWP
jgi:hypothetical protein